MSRYLLTGCAGFIGSTLTERLLGDGASIVGVDAFTDYYAREQKEGAIAAVLAHPEFELIEHDLGTGGVPEAATDGIDGIFHLAARPGVRSSWGEGFRAYTNDNMMATQAVVEAAAAAGVRVVFASSSSIYGDALAYPTPEDTRPAPISPYGVTKLACEHLIDAYARNAGLDFVTLRYFTVYGPRQRPDMAFSRILKALLTAETFEVYGDGEQSRDFTFVADAVTATRAAMHDAPPGSTYNVGGGSEATLKEVVATLEELTGQHLDTRFARPAAGDVRRTLADTSKIRTEIGWNPEFDLRTGLARQVEAARPQVESAAP